MLQYLRNRTRFPLWFFEVIGRVLGFLGAWEGCAQWRTEIHKQDVVFSDASLYIYGSQVEYEGEGIEISYFWEQGLGDDRTIHLKEVEAVFRMLLDLAQLLALG